MKKSLLSLSWVSLFTLSLSLKSFGVLGEVESSVEETVKAISRSTVMKLEHPRLRVYEIRTETLSIKEYSHEGKIFAVTWTGGLPNLKKLFGNYFQDYENARLRTPRIRGTRHSQIAGKSIRVEQAGAGNSLRGIAYVDSLLPKGLNLHELE